MSKIKVGSKVLAFDGLVWSKTGDIGDNSQFYLPATVMRLRTSDRGEKLADVMFNDLRESNGHFLDGLINRSVNPDKKYKL